MRTILLKTVSAALAMAAAGCLGTQPIVKRDAAPESSVGYVGVLFADDTACRFAFTVRSDSGHEYTLGLKSDLALIDLPPGRYRVTKWLATGVVGTTDVEQPIPITHALASPFDVAGGQIVILGSWFGDHGHGAYPQSWSLSQRDLTTTDATDAVHQAYPKFTKLPVSCWLCTE